MHDRCVDGICDHVGVQVPDAYVFGWHGFP
jgi:hypothetical protein